MHIHIATILTIVVVLMLAFAVYTFATGEGLQAVPGTANTIFGVIPRTMLNPGPRRTY